MEQTPHADIPPIAAGADVKVEEDVAEQVRKGIARDYADSYRRNRLQAATLSRKLTALELDRTEMRYNIIKELMKAGLKVTAATEQARTTEEYVSITNEIADTTLRWETSFVEAEYDRMVCNGLMLSHLDTYQQHNAMVELQTLAKVIESRIREVQP